MKKTIAEVMGASPTVSTAGYISYDRIAEPYTYNDAYWVWDKLKGRNIKKVRTRTAYEYYNVFYYYKARRSNDPLPPAVYLYAALNEQTQRGFMGSSFLVNHTPTGWLNKNSYYEQSYTGHPDRGSVHIAREVSAPRMDFWKQTFSLARLGPKPNLPSIYPDEVSLSVSKARRLYMLATFLLLKKIGLVKKDGSDHCHNIAAMLVSKDGEVLAWGANTGRFCHAEVNMLISYFARYPMATTLPSESSIFSTLKPCAMCSSFIQARLPIGGKVRVWYGMYDPGSSGSSTVLGNQSKDLPGLSDHRLDVWELLSPEGTLDDAIKVKGTKPVQVLHPSLGNKVNLTARLNNSMTYKPSRTSAADWVDQDDEVLELFEAASTKFHAKVAKASREEGPVKKVLEYLGEWVKRESTI